MVAGTVWLHVRVRPWQFRLRFNSPGPPCTGQVASVGEPWDLCEEPDLHWETKPGSVTPGLNHKQIFERLSQIAGRRRLAQHTIPSAKTSD